MPLAAMERSIREKEVDDRSETLVRAAIFVNRHILNKASDLSNPEAAKNYFLSIVEYLSDHVQIVRFALSTDSAAYTIFETLNDRGLELAPLDLVKNYLFSQAEKHRNGGLAEVEERWTSMMVILRGQPKIIESIPTRYWSRFSALQPVV